MTKFSKDQMLKELNRELKMRENNYPNWIKAERLSPERANYQIEILKAIIEVVAGSDDGKGVQATMFGLSVADRMAL